MIISLVNVPFVSFLIRNRVRACSWYIILNKHYFERNDQIFYFFKEVEIIFLKNINDI